MKQLSIGKERILRMLGQRARDLRELTHAPRIVTEQSSPNVIETSVLDLCADGLAEFKENRFHITQAGKETLSRLGYFGGSVARITETSGTYVGEKWQIREGGQQHLRCQSRGIA